MRHIHMRLYHATHTYIQNTLKKLQTLQNKSVRSITKSKYNASTGPIDENLGILQISKLYQLEAAKLMFLMFLPSPLQAIFTPNIDIHNHNTRHRNDPHISQYQAHKSIITKLHT